MKAKYVVVLILVSAVFLAFFGMFNLIGGAYLFLAGQEFELANPVLGFMTILFFVIGFILFMAELVLVPEPDNLIAEIKRHKIDFLAKKIPLTCAYLVALMIPICANGINHVANQRGLIAIAFEDTIFFSGFIFAIAVLYRICTVGDKSFE